MFQRIEPIFVRCRTNTKTPGKLEWIAFVYIHVYVHGSIQPADGRIVNGNRKSCSNIYLCATVVVRSALNLNLSQVLTAGTVFRPSAVAPHGLFQEWPEEPHGARLVHLPPRSIPELLHLLATDTSAGSRSWAMKDFQADRFHLWTVETCLQCQRHYHLAKKILTESSKQKGEYIIVQETYR